MKKVQTFGEFLQAKREEREIPLRRMAVEIGISPAFYSDIEKGRRNPPEIEKLDLIAEKLQLTEAEKNQMFDLAGKMRNSVAPDLPPYIMKNNFVSAALRTARDLGAGEDEWNKFVEELQQRKG